MRRAVVVVFCCCGGAAQGPFMILPALDVDFETVTQELINTVKAWLQFRWIREERYPRISKALHDVEERPHER